MFAKQQLIEGFRAEKVIDDDQAFLKKVLSGHPTRLCSTSWGLESVLLNDCPRNLTIQRILR